MTDEVLETAPAESSPVADDQPQGDHQDGSAPEKEEVTEPPKKHRSAREALEKAFAGGSETQPTPEEKATAEAKATEAKDPKPEEKPKEKPKADTKPDAKPEAAKEGPKRAPDGKFAPKEGEKPQEVQKPTTGHGEPPSRFSPDAKAEWEKAPESVRAEANRAVREMEQGIQRYKERTEPLEPFFQMAEQSGQTLQDVVKGYVDMEQALLKNPAQGFAMVAQRMGMSPQQVGQMLLGHQPGQADPRDQQIHTLTQKLQQLEQGYGQINQTFEQQRRDAVVSQIEQFAAENEHFGALEIDIAQLLQSGEADTLNDAYAKALQRAQEMAARFTPKPQEAPPPPTPPAQTREARSLTGAPNPGSNPTTKRTPSKSAREALSRHLLG